MKIESATKGIATASLIVGLVTTVGTPEIPNPLLDAEFGGLANMQRSYEGSNEALRSTPLGSLPPHLPAPPLTPEERLQKMVDELLELRRNFVDQELFRKFGT